MDHPAILKPSREAARLQRLRELLVLDSEPEPVFESIARLASEVCGTPIALISLVDEKRQWFKANVGLDGVTETPRDVAFCAHAILDDQVLEVPDSHFDIRFVDNPLVTGPQNLRFYAGAPLVLDGGERIGTLCVLDHEPRALTDTQRQTLRALSQIAIQTLTMRRDLVTRALTARTDYEEALERSEEQHRLLVEEQTEMVSLADAAGRFVYVNRAHAERFGLQPAEMIGARYLDFVQPADRADVAAVAESVLRTGEASRSENRLAPQDGPERWVAWSNTVQRGSAGEPLLRSVGRDISERKRQEAALAAASAELSDLYQNAPCGYYSLNAQGRFVRANATVTGWLGCTPDALIGTPMTDFLDDAGRALFATNFPRLMAEGHLENLEFELHGRHGETRSVVLSATAIRDACGSFTATRSMAYDVTELKSLKQDLQRLTREQLAILDIDLIGIVKFKDRRISWVNPGAARMLGWPADALIGQPSRVIYADDATDQRIAADAYAAFGAGQVYRTQLPLTCRDGSARWVDALSMSLERGEVMCMVVDITAQRQAEQTRMRSLVLESENRQLIESNRVKSAFLSNMSHELHTPLNAVLGYVHLLRAGTVAPDSPKFAHYLQQIGDSGRHLLTLIDSVLNFAKLESGKFEFTPEPVQLHGLIDEVVAIHGGDMRRKAITLALEIDVAIGPLRLDRLRLAQVLSQFLSNAIKFSHDAGPVSLRATREGADAFRITVTDAGIGVAEADVPRLFSAFQQLSEGRSKAFPGAGLGLALARQLIEAQGGTVGVTSRVGGGSAFHLVLPRCCDAPPRSAAQGSERLPVVSTG